MSQPVIAWKKERASDFCFHSALAQSRAEISETVIFAKCHSNPDLELCSRRNNNDSNIIVHCSNFHLCVSISYNVTQVVKCPGISFFMGAV